VQQLADRPLLKKKRKRENFIPWAKKGEKNPVRAATQQPQAAL